MRITSMFPVDNNLSFYYASQFEENGFRARYSYKLEGYSKDWAAWSDETRTGFTNLKEGHYEFKVKASDLYGNESEIISFKFEILPPWYRTSWAYLLYAVIAVIIVYVIVRLSIMRLKAKNIQLEKIIQKRTEEIRAQKDEIEKQHTIVLKQKEEITSSITYASRIQNALVPGKKFGKKAFTEILVKIHSQPLKIQKNILEKTISDWMQDRSNQIDDILVFGFKIN